MGLRDHRRRAEGKKQKGRRMPSPEQCKMGTQIHETPRYEEEDIEVAKCDSCDKYVEEHELVECNDSFLCYDCVKELEEDQ